MWLLLPLPHMVTTMFFIFQIPAGKGFIHATCSQNSSDQDFGALPALFGPPLPVKGLAGRLVEVRPENACHPIKGPPHSSSSFSSSLVFIALIRRYNCSFATKVLHAQRAGYQAAVVHNVNSRGLLRMVSETDTKKKIRIPSMFTTEVASKILKWLRRSGKLSSVVLFPEYLNLSSDGASQPVPTMSPLLSQPAPTTSACKCHIRLPGPCVHTAALHIFWMIPVSTVIATLLIEKYLSKRRKGKNARSTSYREKGREQARFSLLTSKYQECAICLEKYLEYDSLKVLSCSHAFHSRCIDLWHITQARSKTCPLCMQKVMLVVRLQTVRLWKEEARDHGKNQQLWPRKGQAQF